MSMWVLLNADGSTAAQIHTAGGATPASAGDNPRGLSEHEVARFGAADERLVDGAWARYAPAVPAAVDDAHLADFGPLSIDLAHVQKALEAQLILAGVTLPHGLVASEAAALGLDISTLAGTIVARQAESNAPEIARRVAKMTA